MACLYCGKEIGAFRSLRNEEFCSSEHRKRYGDRLGKALQDLATPEPAPTRLAEFIAKTPSQEGGYPYKSNPNSSEQFYHYRSAFPLKSKQPWRLEVVPVYGSSFNHKALRAEPSPLQKLGFPPRETSPRPSALQMPGFSMPAGDRFVPAHSTAQVRLAIVSPAAKATSAASGIALVPIPLKFPRLPAAARATEFTSLVPVPGPDAEPVERIVLPSHQPATVVPALPVQIAPLQVAPSRLSTPLLRGWMPGLAAEPAERMMHASAAPLSLAPSPGLWSTGLDFALRAAPAMEGSLPGLPAEAAERMVQPSVKLEALAPSALTLVPVLAFGDEAVSPALAPAEAGLAAEAVERMVASVITLDALAPMANPRLPVLAFAPAPPAPAIEPALPALAAEPAERMVAAVIHLEALAPVAIPRLPALTFAPAAVAPALEPALPALAPEPVERMVAASAAYELLASTAPAAMPELKLAAEEPDELAPELEFLTPPRLADVWFPMVPAEPAERAVYAVHDLRSARFPVRSTVPAFPLTAATWAAPPAEAALPAPAAEPAERWLAVASRIEAVPDLRSVAATALPGLGQLADAPDTFVPTAFIWAPPLPAEMTETLVLARSAAEAIAFQSSPGAMLGSAFALPPFADTREPLAPVEGPQAEAVEAPFARERFVPQALTPRTPLALPSIAALAGIATPALAAPAPGLAAEAAECTPLIPPFQVAPAFSPAALATPKLSFNAPTQVTTASFGAVEPAASQVTAPFLRKIADVEPLSGTRAQVVGQPERPTPAIPKPGLIELEFFCQRVTARPLARLGWKATHLATTGPLPLEIELAQDRTEEISQLKPEVRAKGEIAEILQHPEAIAIRARARQMSRFAKIAACLMVAGSLYLGARFVNFGKPNVEAPTVAANDAPEQTGPGTAAAPEAKTSGGPLASMRRALAERAATEVGETFHAGMEAWGAGPKSFVQGWTRHPDGYVKPGALALFAPSKNYKDYRMEFYGQIEQKGMDWVVRAKDKQNYYAMKVKVIEAGMRPVIAMVHYPVTGGKPGHRVETPLNIMIHNNRPYHVTVDVKGDKYTASIEGEQIESWTDNTLLAGGVGFFSEAGERARVYWMRVSRNQDWIGRICGFIAGAPEGGSATNTAELWAPPIPPGKPEPVNPDPRRAETLYGAMALAKFSGPLRAASSNLRRVRLCLS